MISCIFACFVFVFLFCFHLCFALCFVREEMSRYLVITLSFTLKLCDHHVTLLVVDLALSSQLQLSC